MLCGSLLLQLPFFDDSLYFLDLKSDVVSFFAFFEYKFLLIINAVGSPVFHLFEGWGLLLKTFHIISIIVFK